MNHRFMPGRHRTLTWAQGLPPTQQALPRHFGLDVWLRAEFVLDRSVILHDIEYPTLVGEMSFVGGGWGSVLAGMGIFCIVVDKCIAGALMTSCKALMTSRKC